MKNDRFDSLEFDRRADRRRERPAEDARPGTGAPARDAAYFQAMGDAEFRSGFYESALRAYSRALEQDGTVFACWLGQVRSLLALGEYEEADLWCDKALELFPEHPDLLSAKALAALRCGLEERALAYSDNALSREGVSPFAWLCRGEVLAVRGSSVAEHCFEQAAVVCEDAEELAWTHLEASRLLRHLSNFSTAFSHAAAAREALPTSAAAWLEYGLCQASLGLPEAERSLSRALELQPGHPLARAALSEMRRRGPWDRLKCFLRRLLGR